MKRVPTTKDKKKKKKSFNYLNYRVEIHDLVQPSPKRKITNMNPNDNLQEIREVIKEKQIRQDKNGRDYLLLKLENEKTIFVFTNKNLPEERLVNLKEGEEYTFTVKEGLNGSNILLDFEPELGIFV